MTFQEVASDAYIKNGMLAPGETLDANLAAYALREANRLLDQWNIQSLFIWTADILVFDLTALPPIAEPTRTFYWIGDATLGLAQTPPIVVDFDTPRPNRIERANILLSTSTPQSRIPLQILDDMQWSDETVPKLGTTLANAIYDDYADPISRLYLFPYPTVAQNQLELFTWHQILRFAAVTDTFQMPNGYEDAFMLTLSERTAEGVREISATLRDSAAKARANVRSLNSQAPKMSTTDSGMPGTRTTGQGNFFNGWPTQLS